MALFRLREYDEAFREVFSRVIRARAEEAYPLLKEIPTEPRPAMSGDHVLFWNARDLERKLAEFQIYYNAARSPGAAPNSPPDKEFETDR